ncbi:MAG: hypothetical protein ACOCXG_05565 [Nanoarchaeota archaeon]
MEMDLQTIKAEADNLKRNFNSMDRNEKESNLFRIVDKIFFTQNSRIDLKTKNNYNILKVLHQKKIIIDNLDEKLEILKEMKRICHTVFGDFSIRKFPDNLVSDIVGNLAALLLMQIEKEIREIENIRVNAA